MKAAIIDDALAGPTRDELVEHIEGLKSFVATRGDVRGWLEATFGLVGNWKTGEYWEPLFEEATIRQLWKERAASPAGAQLPSSVFAALEQEDRDNMAPIVASKASLEAAGYTVATFPALPGDAGQLNDCEVIVLDYILEKGADPVQMLQKSIDLLKKVIAVAHGAAPPKCPLVLFVSSGGEPAPDAAKLFREQSEIPEAFFKFRAKRGDRTGADVAVLIEDFKAQRGTLLHYLEFLITFRQSLKHGCDLVQQRIRKLEIADMLPLQVAQLQSEGGLGTYLNWLTCAFLHAHLDGDAVLAKANRLLPRTVVDALTGHLGPSNEIPNSFLTALVHVPGEATLLMKEEKPLALQFGDVFLMGANEGETPRAFMIISQTCDLAQGNLNENVLCVDGEVAKLANNPQNLFAATLSQLLSESVVLVKDGDGFLQVTWQQKLASTIETKKLQMRDGYRYLGRLNEIYALNIQHLFISNLGRIGVPVRPMRLICYTKAEIKVVDLDDATKQEHDVAEGYVVGIASMKKDPSVHLTYTPEFVRWLAAFIERAIQKYPADDAFRKKLEKTHATMKSPSYYAMRRKKSGPMSVLSYFDPAKGSFGEMELDKTALVVEAPAAVSEISASAPRQRIEIRLEMPIEIDEATSEAARAF